MPKSIRLKVAGADDEAMAASKGLLADPTAANNPALAAWMLLAYGFAYGDADTVVAYEALRRGLKIAQESGNRQFVSIIAVNLSRFVAIQGDPVDAFDFLTLAIRNYHDSGNLSLRRRPRITRTAPGGSGHWASSPAPSPERNQGQHVRMVFHQANAEIAAIP
jgi:hypothetical protein